MRLLSDENMPKAVVDELRRDGHDVAWARTRCPGATDSELLDLSESEGRILLTLDKDFWQISLQRKMPLEKAGVVLFRVHPATPESIARLVSGFVHSRLDWAAHISVISADGIQMVRSKGY